MGIQDKTVFIDIDDTLILYQGSGIHPFGTIIGEPYTPNGLLIKKLRDFEGNIVVWSGGGKVYADLVAKSVLPEGLDYTVESKFDGFHLVKPGDIIVDDQKDYFSSMEESGVRIYGPLEEWH